MWQSSRSILKARPRQVTNLQVHLGGECRRLHLREELGGLWVLQRRNAWIVKGSEMGDLGGGSFKHTRQWLGTQWPGVSLGVYRASQSRQARPEEAQKPS